MQKEIIKYIEEHLSNEDLDNGIDLDEDLLGSGILDSLGMMKLIAFIEEEYSCKIQPEEMVVENFMTVGNIITFLTQKLA